MGNFIVTHVLIRKERLIMATTSYNHTRMSVVDENGNVSVMYPQNTAEDVKVDKSANTNLPSSANTAQDVLDNLSSLAFATGNPIFFDESDVDQDIVVAEIDDQVTSEQLTWSSKKISESMASVGNTKSIVAKNVNILTTDWVDDTTFTDYPKKAVITIDGATADHMCTLFTPDHTDTAIDGLFGPYTETGTNSLTVWAAEVPDPTVKIEAICLVLVL